MCGIAGLIYKNENTVIAQEIEKMLDTIIHRGPDGVGKEIFDNKIALGHRRLAIIDLSKDGHQPFCINSRYWITFNGEIYNYLELREKLIEKGYSFSTKTDTEVLLTAFIEWGENCVNYFNGMWAFAIYDSAKNKIFCSRDRYGIKPFYFELTDKRFVFASEIKELIAVKEDNEIKVEMDNFIAYLATGVLEANERTMFAGIKKLMGGYNLTFDCNSFAINIYKWYDLSKIELNKSSKEENYDLFREKFLKAVNLRLRADVSVGSCLSGGLDSSSIVCAVHKNLEKSGKEEIQYTVSSCFEDKRYDEQEFIDAVVRDTGVKAYKIFPNMDESFDELDKIIWHMDEPFAGTSIFAQWNVFKAAKECGLTVMLDGQGADEQLAGYTPFYKVLFIDCLKHGKIKRLMHEIKAYQEHRASTEVVKMWEILLSTITSTVLPDWIRARGNKIFRKRYGDGLPFPAEFYDNPVSKSVYKSYDKRNPQNYIDASMHCGMSALLHYEDRDSMAHSIESRVPFLDYELTEFIFSVPIGQKIQEGKTKNILREGMKDILPPEIYNRYSKLGFVTPEDQWVKDNEEIVYHELENACDVLSALLDKDKILSWYKEHVNSTQRGDNTWFRIICAAHWVQIFNVKL